MTGRQRQGANFRAGDLVSTNWAFIRGWATGYQNFPGEYGFHKKISVPCGLGLVVDQRDTFCLVSTNGVCLWLEDHQLDLVSPAAYAVKSSP